MKIIGATRYPCCDGHIKLSEDERDFVAASTTAGMVPQLLRKCRPCKRQWHLTFERADHASETTGLEVFKLAWGEA